MKVRCKICVKHKPKISARLKGSAKEHAIPLVDLLISPVKPTITKTITNINEEIEVAGTDEELLTSHLATFRVTDDLTIQRSFVGPDNRRRDNSNKQQIDIDINGMIYDDGERSQASVEKCQALENVKSLLQSRFAHFDEPIIENMKWYDPKSRQLTETIV